MNKTNNNKKERCGDCIYLRDHKNGLSERYCYRFPPDYKGRRAMVFESDKICGEFKQKIVYTHL